MLEAKKAQFSLDNFTIPKFSYNGTDYSTEQLKIQFHPSGVYHEKSGLFELHLNFTGKPDFENAPDFVVVEVFSIAVFRFEAGLPFAEIPEFFYVNSIGIFFPYLRSFLSTLTLQANTRLILLDLMNLTNLSSFYKTNTICQQD